MAAEFDTRERAHGAARPIWLRVAGAAASGVRTAAVCAAFAVAVVPLLALVPLAIVRHHLRRALRATGRQTALLTR